VQAGGERLLQTHKVVPRPELPAVGMARKLKVKSGLGRRGRAAGLVGQQQAHSVGRRTDSSLAGSLR
jgi:hypothetical protein